eukprot:scaffold9.g3087.t1
MTHGHERTDSPPPSEAPGIPAAHRLHGPPGACDFKKLPEPATPAKYDTTTGLLVVAEGMMKALNFLGDPVGAFAGNLGVGLFTGLRGGVMQEASTSSWQTYQLKRDLVKVQDYLVCKMDSIVGDAVYNLQNYMAEQKLVDFNEAIWGLSSAAALAANPPAALRTHACSDPDGKCYDVYGPDQARAALQQILKMFTSMEAIKNFKAFSQWQDLRATAALAKGAMIKIAERVKYHTNVTRLYHLMDSRSVGGSKDPFAEVSYPASRCFYDCCLGGGWCFSGSDGWCAILKENAVIKVHQRIRKTCTKPLKHKVFTCALPLGFGPGGSEHKCSTVHKTCGLRECVEPSGEHPGLDCGLRGMAYGKCLEEWRTFLNDKSKCPITTDTLKASMEEEAKLYAASVAKELEPVTKLAQELRKLSTTSATAMHGVFLRKGYPALECDNADPPPKAPK